MHPNCPRRTINVANFLANGRKCVRSCAICRMELDSFVVGFYDYLIELIFDPISFRQMNSNRPKRLSCWENSSRWTQQQLTSRLTRLLLATMTTMTTTRHLPRQIEYHAAPFRPKTIPAMTTVASLESLTIINSFDMHIIGWIEIFRPIERCCTDWIKTPFSIGVDASQ